MKTEKKSDLINEYWNHFPLNDYFSFDIAPYTKIVEFEPDEVILNNGVSPHYLLYLFDGRAKLYITHANGRITLVNFISAPGFIGEMELIGAQPTANGIKAITKCRCFAVNIGKCKDEILNDTKFLKYLCVFLCQKALANTANYSRNQSYPLENRLASFILLTMHNAIYSEKHTEASEFLGVTYRHLLYVLADLVKKGILEKTHSGYRIVDISALRALDER